MSARDDLIRRINDCLNGIGDDEEIEGTMLEEAADVLAAARDALATSGPPATRSTCTFFG